MTKFTRHGLLDPEVLRIEAVPQGERVSLFVQVGFQSGVFLEKSELIEGLTLINQKEEEIKTKLKWDKK